MEAWKEELYHYGIKGMRWRRRKGMSYDELQARAAEANYRRTQPMVQNVLKGNYGNEAERQRRLGVNYQNVQRQVNRKKLGRDATPGNYAKDNTRYSSADWSRTLRLQRVARAARAERAKQQSSGAAKSSTKSTSTSSSRSSAYKRGYSFMNKLLRRKKR